MEVKEGNNTREGRERWEGLGEKRGKQEPGNHVQGQGSAEEWKVKTKQGKGAQENQGRERWVWKNIWGTNKLPREESPIT